MVRSPAPARLVALVLAVWATGCSLAIDPDSVKPANACVPTGCAGLACGADDCGTLCGQGSGCVQTHTAQGSTSGGATRTSAQGGHSIRGAMEAGAAPSAPGGHSIRDDALSQ